MRQADEEVFRAFARSQAGPLRRSAYLLCGDWHLADDLVQTTLIKLHKVWSKVSGTQQPVSYARKILLNCWLDERRRPWRRSEVRDGEVPESADPSTDPVLVLQRSDLRGDLFRALAKVAPKARAALVLRYFESLSVGETAEVLGCSEGNVKSQTARGLDALRAVFDGADRPAAVLTRERQ